MPSSSHASTPKRTVPAFSSIVKMLIDNETDSPKPVPPRAMPKSIFASIEILATSSIPTLAKSQHPWKQLMLQNQSLEVLIFLLPVLVYNQRSGAITQYRQSIQCPAAG